MDFEKYEEFGFLQVEIAVPVYLIHKNDHMPNGDPVVLFRWEVKVSSLDFPQEVWLLESSWSGVWRPRERSPAQNKLRGNKETVLG